MQQQHGLLSRVYKIDNFVLETLLSSLVINPIFYDLRLGSGCNLDKDLSRKVGISQLVKHKDTGLYLQLYIPIDNAFSVWQPYVNNITEHEEKIRKQYLLHKVLTETITVQLIIASQKKQPLTIQSMLQKYVRYEGLIVTQSKVLFLIITLMS